MHNPSSPGGPPPVTCAVGVMAYNEEGNIRAALDALASQQTPGARIGSITVVASGCTDRTTERVREAMATDDRIRLIEQPAREGKAAAIREFLACLRGEDVIVLAGADTRPRPGSLAALLRPFLPREGADPSPEAVGMTGGRPAPSNPRRGIVHRIVHVLWDLHHEVSRVEPKMGELIAFRNVVKDFPADTAVDEAMIEQRIRRAGLAVVYAPGAVVDMRGPSTLRELVRQRRRIYAGHVDLARSTGYRVSTMRPSTLLRAVARLRPLSPVRLGSIGAAAAVEIASRMLGWWDVRVAGRRHVVWRVSGTTKNIEGTPELPGRPLTDRPRTGRPAE